MTDSFTAIVPMPTYTLIKNARLVNEGATQEGDLLIKGQHIDRIDSSISVRNARIVEANGCLLLPGLIDDQVHFREPGLEHKGSLETESRAAIAGGITSYMEMPNTSPFVTNLQILEDKLGRAAQVSAANFGFYFGATLDNLEAIKTLPPGIACGLKVFMGASTGGMLVDDPEVLENIFASSHLLIATHCEDTPTILANEAVARSQWGEDVPISEHPRIRSREACLKSSTLAVDLARRHGSRLHILHLTTAEELSLFEAGKRDNKRITAEACVHHLFFDDSWYADKGNFIKCNPAIKTKADQEALLNALREDRLDIIATDHAPHTKEEKERKYLQAPAGLPLVQHALQSLLEHVKAGRLTIERVVDKACHAPADIFGVIGRGYLREGYFADLVLVDDNATYWVDEEPVLAKCGWTPFAGLCFGSKIAGTWVNGQHLWDNGQLMEASVGMRLEYRLDSSL